MKNLIMIAGPAGVGKTTVCRELLKMMGRCAWLDGDWCWMVHPWHPKTDEQKRYVERAFGYLLDGYLADDGTDNILFSGLMHGDFMFDLVTSQITRKNYVLHKFALVCFDRDIYINRMIQDGRRSEQIEKAEGMEKYRALDATVIDVAHLSPQDAAREIIRLVGPSL